MPLDRFVLMLVAVVAAAGLTVFLAVWIKAAFQAPATGILVLVPIALIGYICVRVVRDRLRERAEDGDRYEGR